MALPMFYPKESHRNWHEARGQQQQYFQFVTFCEDDSSIFPRNLCWQNYAKTKLYINSMVFLLERLMLGLLCQLLWVLMGFGGNQQIWWLAMTITEHKESNSINANAEFESDSWL